MSEGSDLRIGVCQTDIVWQDAAANFERLTPKLAASNRCDLYVLPEMFATGFTMKPQELPQDIGELVLQWMQARAKELDACVAGSTPFALPDGQFVNRFLFVEPSGKTSHYDKWHRFTMAGEHEAYASGTPHQVIVECKGWRLLLQVCYDLRFPGFARNQAGAAGYDAVLYVANWPSPRNQHWQVLAKARAIENQAYCIAVNRVGIDPNGHSYSGASAVYDAHGDPQLQLGERNAVEVVALSKNELNALRLRLPFLADRDHW